MKITLGKLTALIMEETERLLSEMDISDDDLDTLFGLARTAEPKRKRKKAKVNPFSHLTIDDIDGLQRAMLDADPSLADTPPDEFSDEEDDLFMGDDEDYMLEGK